MGGNQRFRRFYQFVSFEFLLLFSFLFFRCSSLVALRVRWPSDRQILLLLEIGRHRSQGLFLLFRQIVFSVLGIGVHQGDQLNVAQVVIDYSAASSSPFSFKLHPYLSKSACIRNDYASFGIRS